MAPHNWGKSRGDTRTACPSQTTLCRKLCTSPAHLSDVPRALSNPNSIKASLFKTKLWKIRLSNSLESWYHNRTGHPAVSRQARLIPQVQSRGINSNPTDPHWHPSGSDHRKQALLTLRSNLSSLTHFQVKHVFSKNAHSCIYCLCNKHSPFIGEELMDE